MALEIRQFPCLSDNYGYLIRCSETGACAAIDTPDPAVIEAEAEKAGWDLSRGVEHPPPLGSCRGQ
jgi:hydroxyacylglutathione hydrolase